MNTFLKRISFFVLLVLFCSILVLYSTTKFVKRHHFTNSQTESNLLPMSRDSSYDLLFMGISNARNYSRYNNHLEVEQILNKSFYNLGRGEGACGLNEQLFYLQQFYSKGNQAKQVLLVLSTPMMYSPQLSQATYTFNKEPFEAQFLFHYLCFESEFKAPRIGSYLFSKIGTHWLQTQPLNIEPNLKILEEIDSVKIADGIKAAYGGQEADTSQLSKNLQTLLKLINTAQNHHSEVLIFIPPAVFGKWLGHEGLCEKVIPICIKHQVRFKDLSETMSNPDFYSDHHHLNSRGISSFTELYLKPLINEKNDE